jgi:hypothetical protein
MVSKGDRQKDLALAKQALKVASLQSRASFANTDFRDD